MKRQPTEEQKAIAQAKRQKIRGFCQTIAKMSDQERADLAGKLPAVMTVEGKALSFNNTVLVMLQGGETATVVGGFRQWKANGRIVKKGEHGFGIWIPKFKTNGENAGDEEKIEASELDGFLMGTVFDVSQTVEINGDNHENPNETQVSEVS